MTNVDWLQEGLARKKSKRDDRGKKSDFAGDVR